MPPDNNIPISLPVQPPCICRVDTPVGGVGVQHTLRGMQQQQLIHFRNKTYCDETPHTECHWARNRLAQNGTRMPDVVASSQPCMQWMCRCISPHQSPVVDVAALLVSTQLWEALVCR